MPKTETSKYRKMSTIGLTGMLGDVRRQNNFVLTIKDVTDSKERPNNLDLVIQQAFLPKVSLQVIELRHGNESIKLAGAASWEGGTVTILDVLSKAELEAINDWFDQTYDFETGQVGFADSIPGVAGSGYKKDGFITEYASDGKFARQWDVRGMWINNLDLGALNAAQAEGKELSFTIQIDPSPTRPRYGEDYTNDDITADVERKRR